MVLKERMDSPPLLSWETLKALGFLAIDKEGRLNSSSVEKTRPNASKALERFAMKEPENHGSTLRN